MSYMCYCLCCSCICLCVLIGLFIVKCLLLLCLKRLARTSAAAGTAALPTECDVVVSRTSLSHKRLARTSAAAGTAPLPTACVVVVLRTSLSHATAADTSTATLKARGAPWPIALVRESNT